MIFIGGESYMIILWIVLAVIVLFLGILLLRAAMFVPKEEVKASGSPIALDEKKIVDDMVEMIRCKTVSYNDESLIVCKISESAPSFISKCTRHMYTGVRRGKRHALSLERKNRKGAGRFHVPL